MWLQLTINLVIQYSKTVQSITRLMENPLNLTLNVNDGIYNCSKAEVVTMSSVIVPEADPLDSISECMRVQP